jgi:hypothetical protein
MVVTCLLLAGGALLLVAVFGRVTGEQFSPTDFRRRRIEYFQVPWLQIRLSPVASEPCDDPLSARLRTGDLLPPPEGRPRWDLVSLSEAGRREHRGDAGLLTSYLDALAAGEGELGSLAATSPRTESTRVLWNAVAQAARHGLYVLVPGLFRLGQQPADPRQLAARLREYAARRALRLAEAERAAGDPAVASRLQAFARDVVAAEWPPGGQRPRP